MSQKKEQLQRLQQEMNSRYGENATLSVNPDPENSVTCHNGVFVPKMRGSVRCFRGIPFAMPPIGKRRFKAPEPAPEGSEIREAYYNAKSPIQSLLASERASLYPQSEDCLYLNVWTNNGGKKEGKPIMVFIHGGSYGWGGTADPLYDGYNFISYHKDVILVTIAYRVGILGFIDFSSLSDGNEYKDAPNLGILDQIEALRYIKMNAKAFGGDPENITIFGESAGGGSVSLLPLIDSAKGLFQRVIAESGSVALTFSKKECQPLTDMLIKRAGVSTVKELVALSEEKIKEINAPLNDYNNFPQRDGVLIPIDAYAPYENGETIDIPMLMGTNQNEMNYWIGEIGGVFRYSVGTPIKFRTDLNKLSKEDQERAKKFMKTLKGNKIWRATEFYNELMFRLPAIHQMEAHSRNGGKAYMYYWEEGSKIPMFHACHAVELAYVFLNIEDTVYTGEKANEALAKEASTMWVNFATCGDPSTENKKWETYNELSRLTMVFLADGKSHTEGNILAWQKELLDPLLRYWICPSYADLDYNLPFLSKLGVLFNALGTAIETLISGKAHSYQ